MITPSQVDAIKDKIQLILDPVNSFILKDIAERVSKAGKMTRTAQYEQEVRGKLKGIEKTLQNGLNERRAVASKEFERLFEKVAVAAYSGEITDNRAAVRALEVAIDMANEELKNMTQTKAIGIVGINGDTKPLMDAYNEACDFAFKKVFTGAQDYQSAVRDAIKNVSQYGLQDEKVYYESGVKTSMDAAIRRNVLGALGIMTEKIQDERAKEMHADGWEISAHEGSAPDHEPYQGLQYSDEAYKALNNRLKRRISTLNCKHIAFPIILGVSEPQYTKEQLKAMKDRNAKGIEYEGKHYTIYEATQMQRSIERNIRLQRRRILTAEASGDADMLQTAKIKQRNLEIHYKNFSKAANLRTQPQRLETLGYGPRQEGRMMI